MQLVILNTYISEPAFTSGKETMSTLQAPQQDLCITEAVHQSAIKHSGYHILQCIRHIFPQKFSLVWLCNGATSMFITKNLNCANLPQGSYFSFDKLARILRPTTASAYIAIHICGLSNEVSLHRPYEYNLYKGATNLSTFL